MRMIECTVPAALDGATVEACLRSVLQASVRCVRRAKRRPGGILLDGCEAWTSAVVQAGQHLALDIADDERPGCTDVPPEPGPVAPVYEDDDLLVLDKPADLVMYPGPGHAGGTLLNFVLQYFLDTGRAGYPHAVNRIDRGTTGLVVFACSGYAGEALQRQLHTRAFARTYLALCAGCLEGAGTVDAPIARVEAGRIGFAVDPAGKPARTHWRTLGTFALPDGASATLVRLVLDTGRTHQIRLHMAHLGHPLVGDAFYGTASAHLARAALHSWDLELDHPLTGAHLHLRAPLPDDLAALVPQGLRAQVGA